jgi:transposase
MDGPADADARITRMKDGRTHLAHKAEHAVDLGSGDLLRNTLDGHETEAEFLGLCV